MGENGMDRLEIIDKWEKWITGVEMDEWKKIDKWEKMDKWEKVYKWEKMDKWEEKDKWEKIDKWEKMDKWEEMDKWKKIDKWEKKLINGRNFWLNITRNMETVEEILIYFWTMSENRSEYWWREKKKVVLELRYAS